MSSPRTGSATTRVHLNRRPKNWCRKCTVKHLILGEISTTQLQNLFDLGPGARLGSTTTKRLQVGKVRSAAQGNILITVTKRRYFNCQVDILPLLLFATINPREFGVDPIFEFDLSAAEWLGMTEI